MNGGRGDAVLDQLLRETVGAVLGPGEYQDLFPIVMANQVRQKIPLVLLIDQMNLLVHQFRCGIAASDFDILRLVQQTVGQGPDFIRERGREQQVLPVLGQQCQDFPDIADESHIQHAVRFVQHQDFDAGQIYRFLADMIEQSAGCGDQNVDRPPESLDLRVDADTAEHHHRFQR